MSPFRGHYGAFDPETLALLEISFNETWTELQRDAGTFDPASMKGFVADLLIEFVGQGETNPRRLKALTLAAVNQRVQILRPVKKKLRAAANHPIS
jgi:hypothetical protein